MESVLYKFSNDSSLFNPTFIQTSSSKTIWCHYFQNIWIRDLWYELVGFLTFLTVDLGFCFLDVMKSSTTHLSVFQIPTFFCCLLACWLCLHRLMDFRSSLLLSWWIQKRTRVHEYFQSATFNQVFLHTFQVTFPTTLFTTETSPARKLMTQASAGLVLKIAFYHL